MDALTAVTGTVEWRVGTEVFHTWFISSHSIEDLRSTEQIPLVALHGGPGISHSYMLPHFELSSSFGVPVILYDQIGIGRSTHAADKPPSFWTPELFMDELENVLAHFGITEQYNLLGHSWGGMLAAQFAAERQPRGLEKLVLVGATASVRFLADATRKLLRTFPPAFQAMIHRHEEEGTTNATEYQNGIQEFYERHICQIVPFPKVLNASFGAMAEDPTVYSSMIGPSEFSINGTLKTWDIVNILPKIQVPTLITNGLDDEIQDNCVLPFVQRIPDVSWVHFARSHMPFLEESERYFKELCNFLHVCI